MRELAAFRDHARAMSRPGAHRPDCVALLGRRPYEKPNTDLCTGECITAGDRTLWIKLAAEADRYLGAPR